MTRLAGLSYDISETGVLNVRPFADFDAAATAALAYLQRRIGFDLWLLARRVGDEWVILKSKDISYGIDDAATLRWIAGYCARLVVGKSPNITSRASEIQTFAKPPSGKPIPIGAYVGVPLKHGNGELFGALCAINPRPMPEIVSSELPLVDLLGRMMATQLETELRAEEEKRRAETAELDAMIDTLTGLYNRRGWDQLLAAEDDRCRRYGHPACVCVVDLDDLKVINDSQGHAAGDELLRRTAEVLVSAVRDHDIVARVGGDEFALLGIECDDNRAEAFVWRIQNALKQADIRASVGLALRAPDHDLASAWDQADADMYTIKHAQRDRASNT